MRINFFNRVSPVQMANEYAQKHVHINDRSMPDDIYNTLIAAKDTIGNYARAHNVEVKIQDGSELIPDVHSAFVEQMLQNKISLEVSPVHHAVVANAYKSKHDAKLIDYAPKDGKSFLRSLYENLQYLVEQKTLRINTETDRTRTELLKIGKIK